MLKLLRIHQWLKNLMLFFPPFLGGTFFPLYFFPQALLPFISFCAASSAAYVINDLFDIQNDRHHPEKCTRPLASGDISVTYSLFLIVALLACSVAIAWDLSVSFFILMAAYIVISLAYSVKLKEIVLVDIFCISIGFLLRLQAGGIAFNVPVSEWLFLSVFLLSLFLSTGKRLAEKQRLGVDAYNHRKSLSAYPQRFLEGTMYMTGGAVLVTYTMYIISRHSSLLLYSVPLCCFGLMRFILRVQAGQGGDPTESLTKDVPLFVIGLAWVIMVWSGIYG